MRRICLFGVALLLFFSSCEQKNAVTGEVKGLTNDTLLVMRVNLEDYGKDLQDRFSDTIVAVDGKFAFDPAATGAVKLFIIPKEAVVSREGGGYIPGAKVAEFVLLPGEKVKLEGTLNATWFDYKLSGAPLAEELSRISSPWRYEQHTADSIEMLLHEGRVPFDSVAAQRREVYDKIREGKLDYIRTHLDNLAAGYYLAGMPMDTTIKYYALLSEDVKNSALKPMLDYYNEQIERYHMAQEAKNQVTEGTVAPDFTLKTDKGEDFTLSSLKGKYAVLDFWGSWCGYCIKGIPDMKKYYDKYKGKVEFVSIACRDNDEKWREALGKYEMPWIQVRNNDTDAATDLSIVYGIEGYPTKYILDGNGVIVSKIIGERPEFYKKLDELLEK